MIVKRVAGGDPYDQDFLVISLTFKDLSTWLLVWD